MGTIKSQYRQAKESRAESEGDMISPDIQVIINGHRYNLSWVYTKIQELAVN